MKTNKFEWMDAKDHPYFKAGWALPLAKLFILVGAIGFLALLASCGKQGQVSTSSVLLSLRAFDSGEVVKIDPIQRTQSALMQSSPQRTSSGAPASPLSANSVFVIVPPTSPGPGLPSTLNSFSPDSSTYQTQLTNAQVLSMDPGLMVVLEAYPASEKTALQNGISTAKPLTIFDPIGLKQPIQPGNTKFAYQAINLVSVPTGTDLVFRVSIYDYFLSLRQIMRFFAESAHGPNLLSPVYVSVSDTVYNFTSSDDGKTINLEFNISRVENGYTTISGANPSSGMAFPLEFLNPGFDRWGYTAVLAAWDLSTNKSVWPPFFTGSSNQLSVANPYESPNWAVNPLFVQFDSRGFPIGSVYSTSSIVQTVLEQVTGTYYTAYDFSASGAAANFVSPIGFPALAYSPSSILNPSEFGKWNFLRQLVASSSQPQTVLSPLFYAGNTLDVKYDLGGGVQEYCYKNDDTTPALPCGAVPSLQVLEPIFH